MKDKLKTLTSKEFIKIVNGDFKDDKKYKQFYDSEDDRIYFHKIKITGDLAFNSLVKPIKKIEIYDSDFENIIIAQFESDFGLSFSSINIQNFFWILSAKLPEFSITDCIFTLQFRIFNIQTEVFHIQDSEMKSISFLGRSGFNQESNIDLLTIGNTKIAYILFEGGSYKETELGGNEINELLIKGGKFESLDINFSIIEKINFYKNSSKDSKIVFRNIQAFEITFESFINYGLLYFISCYSKNNFDEKIEKDLLLNTVYSDLGKTTFLNTDWNDYKWRFIASKISDLFLADSLLPKAKNIFSDKKQDERLALSQIKKIYENRGDSIESSKYQAEELNVHLETLKFGGEKINLLLNKYSNGHGQNWPRALVVTLVISFLYILYMEFGLLIQAQTTF